MRIIVSCSDWTDVAQAECEIAALKHAPADTRFISVSVEQFSSLNCAFHVRLIADALPNNSVIMASADPRTPGIPREPIVIYFGKPNLYLVCPNIGISTLLLESYTPTKAIHLAYDEWESSLWNGRDIYAPTAGRIMSGARLEELGEEFPLSSIYNLEIKYGTVIHIDNYGNVKLNAYDDLTSVDHVIVNGRQISVVSNFKLSSGKTVAEGELVATNGASFGLVEIMAKADGKGAIGAAEKMGVDVGDLVDLSIC